MNNPIKFELCVLCNDFTGKAGQGDGSLYDLRGNGPYCEECFACVMDDDDLDAIDDLPASAEQAAKDFREGNGEVR